MRLYIIRHGDPDYRRDTLTERGHQEARALATRLATHGLDHLYVSPLGRAVATAHYTGARLRRTPVVAEWTAELPECMLEQPPWGLMQAWELPGELIRAGTPLPSHDTWHGAPPFDAPVLAATYAALQRHSDAFLERHGYRREGGRYRCVAPNRDRIAIVCHYGFGVSWLAHLLALPLVLAWAGFWLPTSSVTTILFEERSACWAVPRCIGLGDVGHLYAAGLEHQPVGLRGNFH